MSTFMGGADNVLRQAKQSFDEGDYRWVAEVVNHVVFADADNMAAKHLLADAYEQLGYQAEIRTVAELLPDRRPGAAPAA